MKTEQINDIIQICEKSKLNAFYIQGEFGELYFEKERNPAGDTGRGIVKEKAVNSNYETEKITEEPAGASLKDGGDTKVICSSVVGIVHLNPSFKDKVLPFEAGQKDILCTVEAMKIYTDITAPEKCRIQEILFQDGDMIQYDQELFRYQVVL